MQHQVIAAPTDTVYGVMCRWDSPQAIAQLYAVKERPPDKAIPILIGALDQLELFIEPPLPPVALALIEHLNLWRRDCIDGLVPRQKSQRSAGHGEQ